MQIRVEYYAGYRGAQEPQAFWLGRRRIGVLELLDRWLSPEHRYFKVNGEDGNTYVLRYDEVRDEWSLGAYRSHRRPAGDEGTRMLHSSKRKVSKQS